MMEHATTTPAGEGERQKCNAFALHEDRRGGLLHRARRAFIQVLLARGTGGTATIDEVRAAVELPPGVNPTCFGAVFRPLARAGIIRRVGTAKSVRPETHARPVDVWELVNTEAAVAWLRDHHDPPDAERAVGSAALRQATLY